MDQDSNIESGSRKVKKNPCKEKEKKSCFLRAGYSVCAEAVGFS
jgi:hypothetical protein